MTTKSQEYGQANLKMCGTGIEVASMISWSDLHGYWQKQEDGTEKFVPHPHTPHGRTNTYCEDSYEELILSRQEDNDD